MKPPYIRLPLIPIIITIIGILGIVTLIPFVDTGLTIRDDTLHQLYAHKPISDITKLAHDYATSQSRFYFLFSTWLIVLPYMVESVRVAKIIGMFFIGINISLFSYVLSKITKSWIVGVLAALVFFVGLQNTSEHNTVNIYPFTFTFSFSLILLALFSFWNTLKTDKRYWPIVGAAAYAWAIMTYEIFIPYILLFALVGILYGDASSRRQRVMSCLKRITPYVCVLGIYFVLYFSYQSAHPTAYEGRTLAPFSIANYTQTVAQLDGSSFPLYYYFSTLYRPLAGSLSYSLEGDQWNPVFVLTHLQPQWILRISLVLLAVFFIVKYQQIEQLQLHALTSKLFLIGLAIFIIPALIISLTEKYQSWVLLGWSKSMPMTYFAYFGACVLVTDVILFIWQTFYKTGWLFRAGIVSLLLVLICIPTDFVNSYTTLSQKQAAYKWDMVDQLVKTDVFRSIPENSFIYAPSLFTYMNFSTYWQDYVSTNTGKQLVISPNINDLTGYLSSPSANVIKNVYFLKYAQETRDQSQYMVIAPIENTVVQNNSALYSDKATILSQSKYRKFNLFVPFINADTNRRVDVNRTVNFTNDSYYWATVDKSAPGNSIVETTVQAKGINPNMIMLTYYDNPAIGDNSTAYPENWSNGCNDRNSNGSDYWHMCGPKATVVFQNNLQTSVKLELRAHFISFSKNASTLTINGLGITDSLLISRAARVYTKEIFLKPGQNTLTFTSDAEKSDPIDPFDARFAVINLSLTQPTQ